MKNAILLIFSAIFILAPFSVVADSSDGLLCAAVYACNQDGSVMAPYNEGECAQRYERQCLSKKVNELNQELDSVIKRNQKLAKKVSKLRKRVRARNRRK